MNTQLVLQTLVGQIGEEVRRRVSSSTGVAGPFAEDAVPSFGADPQVALQVAEHGYHARAAELEMFAPAREEVPGLARELATLTAPSEDRHEAVLGYARSVAESEPLGRPGPQDEAFAWRVPGPGGHVRHYVALSAIADVVEEPAEPYADLKRSWTFGFCVRSCEGSS